MINRKFRIAIFMWFICLPFAAGQYFEFTGNSDGNGFQQGCPETYDVYFNTEGETDISVGEILTILDESNLIYSTATGTVGQNSLFLMNQSGNDLFTSWHSTIYPQWRSQYDEVKIALKNPSGVISGYHKYGSFLFTGKYNQSDYYSNFLFLYYGSSDQTVLSRGGINLINPDHQNSRLTGTIHIEQKPCVDDTQKPMITITDYSSGGTKYKNVGLKVSLKDNSSVGSVPYVFDSNGVWTGNPGGIDNQYGVDENQSITIIVSGKNESVTFSGTITGDFNYTADGKTWENKDKNYTLTISEDDLFNFGVEDTITIIVRGIKDRKGNTNSNSISFNNPVAPYVDHNYPANSAVYIPTAAKISFDIHDDWAGVNPDSISVTISGVVYNSGTNSERISIELIEGSATLGSGAGYHVVVTPVQRFSELQNVTVVARYSDLKGTAGSKNWSFKTSPNCSELACCSIDILLGENGIQGYQNQQLLISGGNPTVTSLTGYGEYTGRIFEINCNVTGYGLSLYSGHQDDNNPYLVKSGILLDEIYLSGDNDVVKAELSGKTLILGLKIDDISLIGDRPYSGEVLDTGNVNFIWHIEGNGDYSRVSGYIVNIYSGGHMYLSGKVIGNENTGWLNYLPDGEYERSVVAFDNVENESASSELARFVVDTTAPDFTFDNGSGYECETGYLIIENAGDVYSNSVWYQFGENDWSNTITSHSVYSPITGVILVTGYVKDSADNIAEKTATYEFMDTGITLVSPYVTGLIVSGTSEIGDVITLLQATEGACGTEKLTGEIVDCSLVEGTLSDGVLSVVANEGVEGIGRCEIKISDDDGSWNTGKIEFRVDNKAPICEIILPNTCTSGDVQITLSGTDVYRYNFNNAGRNIWEGNIMTGVSSAGEYVLSVRDVAGNISSCTGLVDDSVLDQTKPTILTLSGVSVPECTTGTANVTAEDDGCGNDPLTYSWNGGNFSEITSFSQYSGSAGSKTISVKVQDNVGNKVSGNVRFEWTNAEIEANNITVTGVGKTPVSVDWKIKSEAHDGLCGSETVFFSGFVSAGGHGICTTGEGNTIIYTPNLEIEYAGDDICEIELIDDENTTKTITITFEGIDTKKPECSISYNDICTNEGISLSMIATGATEYSWTGFSNMSNTNAINVVNANGIYRGYVKDAAGNTGICTKTIDNFDDISPIVTGANRTGEECTVIQGNIQSSDEGCGSGELIYNWGGYGIGNGLHYSGYSDVVTGKTATVTVTDGAGNTQTANVNYQWTNTIPTLTESILTYGTTVTGKTLLYDDLIESMGAEDGACGSETMNKTGDITCTAGSAEWIEYGIEVTPAENGTGEVTCTVWFVDDEGSEVSGKVVYTYDTKKPGVELTGTNLACMNVGNFVVTGTFSESVNGFESGDIDVTNGSASYFEGNGAIYTWRVDMDPMVEVSVQVPAGVASDNAGNSNTVSNPLVGQYDNVGPEAVTLIKPDAKVYADFTTLMWQSTNDSGCAGVSGYNWEIYSGACGEGTRIDSGFVLSGADSQAEVDGLVNSGHYCRRVQPIDNFGNEGEWTTGEFTVDLSNIGCTITPVDNECTSGTVQVKLESPGDYPVGQVYLSWIGTGDHSNTGTLYTGVIYSGQIITGYIYQTITNKSNVCVYTATNIIDQILPTISTLDNVEVEECTTGEANIVANDDGCGNNPLRYKWNGGYFEENNTTFEQWSGKVGTKTINVWVMDVVGNITGSNVAFTWTNTPITGHDFTGSENVGNSKKTVNWRIKSEAKDGVCGNGENNVIWSGFVNTGSKGECTRSGDEITYTPKPNMTGEDSCEIELVDDEGSGVPVTITWKGIDTKKPTCIIAVADGCFSGGVELSVTSNEIIKTVVGGGIQWNREGNNATGLAYSNGEIEVTITDESDNTGVCTAPVNNISTGVLSAPAGLRPISGTQTNQTTQNFMWNSVSNSGCRELSGYEYQRCKNEVCSNDNGIEFVSTTTKTVGGLVDGRYYWRVRAVDKMGGRSEWAESLLIINTQKPECTISYEPQECTDGIVTLSIAVNEGLYYSWTGVGITGSNVTKNVSSNGTYKGYVRDVAGNTGECSTGIDNISTGVLGAPDGLRPESGTTTNDKTPTLSWNNVIPAAGTCRTVSGYNYKIYSGEVIVDSGSSDNTIIEWTTKALVDGTYYWMVQTVDSLGGESEWTGAILIVDSTAPVCEIVIPEGCYSGNVQIRLSGDNTDIKTYSRWNMLTGDFIGDIVTGVNSTGTYVGYVWDAIGNTGVCTGIVTNNILDQNEISYEITNATGAECTTITGRVEVGTGDGCGNENLNGFVYSWVGGSDMKENGVYSGKAGDTTIDLTIINHAGISVTTGVRYTWTDSAVTLDSGNTQNIGTISGNYTITTGGLINKFGAKEGACGKVNVTVTGVDCSGASMNIVNGIVTIIPDSNLNSKTGYCEFEFGDDELYYTVTGKLEFTADNVGPEIELTGDIACVKGGTSKTITGTWSEEVLGFEIGDVSVTNGTIGNNWLINSNPIYSWSVISSEIGVGTTTVTVSGGVARDAAGNTNLQDKFLSREYDNVGPNDIEFDNWQDTGYATTMTLRWKSTADSGCAGVSGYNYKFVEGSTCDGSPKDSGFIENTSITADDLENGHTYTLCVQPIDKVGNKGNWTSGSFVVDLSAIACEFEEIPECTSGQVTVKLKPQGQYGGTIYLSWVGTGEGDRIQASELTTGVNQSGYLLTGYIYQGNTQKSSSCTYVVSHVDNEIPVINEVEVNSVPECTSGRAEVKDKSDDGCGNIGFTYSWDGGSYGSSDSFEKYNNKAGTGEVSLKIMDNVGNESLQTGVIFTWTNAVIEADDFTGSAYVGNTPKTANWKTGSNARDGLCGSGTVFFSGFVSTGNHGICTRGEGDTIIYTPNEGFDGRDECIIQVRDDEYSVKNITIYWGGIDTEKPTCTLDVQAGQQCTSGDVTLVINAQNVSSYSFDGVNFGPEYTTGVNDFNIYTGYVKDSAGNTGLCTGMANTGVLDQDNPSISITPANGLECTTITGTVQGNDQSCGVSALTYSWELFDNITQSNGIYNDTTGVRNVTISVIDGVGHERTGTVTYTWNDDPVVGQDFTVNNAGNGITVDRFTSGSVSAGACELTGITAITSSTGCSISGHKLTYTPAEGQTSSGTCILTVSDDDGSVNITVTFEGIDNKKPTVDLIGEDLECTTTTGVVVTGIFSEAVQGVVIGSLTGENVNILSFTGIDDQTYVWTLELVAGGTGKVRISKDGISDIEGNELEDNSKEVTLGNLDETGPEKVELSSPGNNTTGSTNQVTWNWNPSNVSGCAGIDHYVLKICENAAMTDLCDLSTENGTSKSETKNNGTYYWNVVAVDTNGNESEVSDTWKYTIESIAPQCHIEPLSECTSGAVELKLISSRTGTIIASGGIVWNPDTLGIEWTGSISENLVISGIIIRDTDGHTGQCEDFPVTVFDNTPPTLTADNVEIDECTTGSFTVTATDDGCASGNIQYRFGSAFGNSSWISTGIVTIPWTGLITKGGMDVNQLYRAKDGNDNKTDIRTGTIHFVDAEVTLRQNETGIDLGKLTGDYIGETGVKDIFSPREGENCEDNDITWKTGSCYLSGILENDITLTLFANTGFKIAIDPDLEKDGTGYCEVVFEDNEGNTATGNIYFEIDTRKCLDKDEWDNDYFLTPEFWGYDPSDKQVICALYGSGGEDQTAYTMGWSGYTADSTCSGFDEMEVVWTGELPATLEGNTVYVLTSTGFTRGTNITLPRCTAIVSNQTKGKDTIIKNAAVTMDNEYGILDNLSLAGNNGIGVDLGGTDNTLNVVKIYNNNKGVELEGSRNMLNNIQAYGNTIGIEMKSSDNAVNNSQIYRNSIGMNVNANNNVVYNTEMYQNNTGLNVLGGNGNTFEDIELWNNGVNAYVIPGLEGDNKGKGDMKQGPTTWIVENTGVVNGNTMESVVISGYYRVTLQASLETAYSFTCEVGKTLYYTGVSIASGSDICDSENRGEYTGHYNTRTGWLDYEVVDTKAMFQGGSYGYGGEIYPNEMTTPRYTDGTYLNDFLEPTKGKTTIGDVKEYSYGYSINKQKDTKLWNEQAGGQVYDGFFIGSNVKRYDIDGKIDRETKLHYTITGTASDPISKYDIKTTLATTVSTIIGYEGNSWTKFYDYNRFNEYTGITINTSKELFVKTGDLTAYPVVVQMYNDTVDENGNKEYFAEHRYAGTLTREVPVLQVEPGYMCVYEEILNMTGTWTGYEYDMTGFDYGNVQATQNASKTGVMTKIGVGLYTWQISLSGGTGKVTISANPGEDILEFTSTGNFVREYYRDIEGPEVSTTGFEVEECTRKGFEVMASDYCAGVSGYMMDSEMLRRDWQSSSIFWISSGSIGRIGGIEKTGIIHVMDKFGNTGEKTIIGNIIDIEPTVSEGISRNNAKDYQGVVTGTVTIDNIIGFLGANEGACEIEDLVVAGVSCDEGATGTTGNNSIQVEFSTGVEGDIICGVRIEDNEHSAVTGYIKFTVDTQKPTCSITPVGGEPQCTNEGRQVEMTVSGSGTIRYSWTGYGDGNMVEYHQGDEIRKNISENGEIYCFVEDENGNQYTSEGSDTYAEEKIDTGSMTAPGLSSPEDKTVYTGTRDVRFNWTQSTTDGCANISGYKLKISKGSGSSFDSLETAYSINNVKGTQVTVENIADGVYYWKVYAVDEFGYEVVSEHEWMFEMSGKTISCEIIDETMDGLACTTGDIRVTLNVNRSPFSIVESGNVDNWEVTGDTYTAVVSGSIGNINGVVIRAGSETGSCSLSTLNKFDDDGPVLSNNGLGNLKECTAGTLTINANDEGCANNIGELEYQFGPSKWSQTWSEIATMSLTAEQVGRTGGTVNQTIKVRDGLGNMTTEEYQLEIEDVEPTIEDANLGTLTGTRVVNINANEGACGTGDLDTVNVECSTGVTGSVEGFVLTITPNPNYEGTGHCDVTVEDNEGSQDVGRYEFRIDTKAPSCSVTSVENNPVCTSGNRTLVMIVSEGTVKYSWTGFDTLENIPDGGGITKEINTNGAVHCFVEDEYGNRWTTSGTNAGYQEDFIDNGSATVHLASPEDGYPSPRDTITFNWNAAPGICASISGYIFEVSTKSGDNFDTAIQINENMGTSKTKTVSGLEDGVYYWRVTVIDDLGNNVYSDIWMFEVISTDLNCGISNSSVNVNELACTAGDVMVVVSTERPNTEITGGGIDWIASGTQQWYAIISGNIGRIIGVELRDTISNETKSCDDYILVGVDIVGPVIDDKNGLKGELTECTAGTLTISANDGGCAGGEGNLMYYFGPDEWERDWTNSNVLNLTAEKVGRTGHNVSQTISVKDRLGNMTTEEYQLEIKDIEPTIEDANLGTLTGIRNVDINASEGACGTGDLDIVNVECSTGVTGSVEGFVLTITPNPNYEGTGYCDVTVEDNEGSQDVGRYEFGMDTKKPTCSIQVTGLVDGQCTSGGVELQMFATGADEYSWTGYNNMAASIDIKTVSDTGIYKGYVRDNAGNTGVCQINVTGGILDNDAPTIEISSSIWSGVECSEGSITVTGDDAGCGIRGLTYNWMGFSEENTGNTNSIYSSIVKTMTGRVEVIDGVGNKTGIQVTYIWNNVQVTGHDFTGSENVGTGVRVNWKTGGNVHAGSCEDENVAATVDPNNKGTIGTCSIAGTDLIYTPQEGQTGSDTCTLIISDDDGTGSITVTFAGIDTKAPTCDMIIAGNNGLSCTSGNVTLTLNTSDTDGIEYSRDGENWNNNSSPMDVRDSGIYKGYIKDTAGNIATCTEDVTGIDNTEPTMTFSTTYWTGYECSEGSVTVTGHDEGCGVGGLRYEWKGFDNVNTTQINTIYSDKVDTMTGKIVLTDGVGNTEEQEIVYKWIDDPLTGGNFDVPNVKTGVTVNWKTLGGVHAGDCEEVYVVSIYNSKCTTGDNYQLTYIPNEGQEGTDECILTVTDGDTNIDITVRFAGINNSIPEVMSLEGGLGSNECTSGNVFTVTGQFSEDVTGVILTGENVSITEVSVSQGTSRFVWKVTLLGGIGKVWLTGDIRDDDGNTLSTTPEEYVLADYDGAIPEISVSISSGFECTTITGSVSVQTGDSCGKDSLDKFSYDWDGGEGTNNIYAIPSNVVTGYDVSLIVTDGAGNNTTTGVRYIWNDSPVTLDITEYELGVLEIFNTGSSYLTDLFGANEGACGKTNITVSGGMCSGATISIEDSGVTITSLPNIGGTGRCEIVFSDDDSNSATGILYFVLVKKEPTCSIGAMSSECTNTGIQLKMHTENATRYSRDGITFENIDGNITKTVTGGIYYCYVEDGYGNTGSGWIDVSSKYDVTGPTKPELQNVGGTIITSSIDINWSKSTATGCAKLSGYVIKVCESGANSCQTKVTTITGWTATSLKSKTRYNVTLWAEDNLGNKSPEDEGTFYVDTDGITCHISASRTTCGTGPVTLILTGDGDMLAWSSIEDLMTTGRLEQVISNLDTSSFIGYVKDTDTGRTGYCIYDTISSLIDLNAPIINSTSFEGMQCTTITGNIGASDVGCAGNSGIMYNFAGGWTNNNKYSLTQNDTGIQTITVGIKDSLGNQTSGTVTYKWLDQMPTASGFTLDLLAGNNVNWKTSSRATEGKCLSERLSATVTFDGIRGTCSVSEDVFTYTPIDTTKGLSDQCTLRIRDMEGNTVDIPVTIININETPTVKLITPADGSLFEYGSAVDLRWRVVNQGEVEIQGFNYRISNSTREITGYTTNTWVSGLQLLTGNYNWEVSIVFADEYIDSKSDTRKLSVYKTTISKDNCPRGDFSPSFYDGICTGHGSATSCIIDSIQYSEELQEAYLYACMHGITTQDKISYADMDGYLYRDHFAKMISVYAMNVAGRTPKYGKYGCDKFDDIADDSPELQSYMKLSCELQLMGMNSDGVTPKTYFDPHSIVTRAEFGTVFSRLIFGDQYNVKNEAEVYKQEGFWYKKHLQALKTYGVMTMIDGDWPKYLERRGRVMLMMQRADNYGLFQGKVPARNGVTALFTQ